MNWLAGVVVGILNGAHYCFGQGAGDWDFRVKFSACGSHHFTVSRVLLVESGTHKIMSFIQRVS